MLDMHSAPESELNVSETIAIHLRLGESETRVNFAIVNELVVLVLLGTTCIDRFIKWMHLVERKIIADNSLPVPIITIHEARSRAERNITESRQEIEKESALLVTHFACGPKSIMVARQIVLKTMSETQLIVSK